MSDDYHPTPVSRDFSTSVGGWTAETTRTGLVCVTGLTCPEVTSAYVATGGAAGNADGFIRTTTGAVGSAVNVTDATWTSSSFVYDGAGGQVPDSVTFTLDRRADTAALLAVLGGVRYRVVLDDTDHDTSMTLVDRVASHRATWTSLATVDVSPAALTLGDTYRFRIVTELGSLAAVLPGAVFDYDNVRLLATKADAVPVDTDSDGISDDTDNCVTTPTRAAGRRR